VGEAARGAGEIVHMASYVCICIHTHGGWCRLDVGFRCSRVSANLYLCIGNSERMRRLSE